MDEKIFDSEELFGKWARETREALCNLEQVSQKVNYIQEELIKLSRRKQQDNRVIDFCVSALKSAYGRMPVRELERRTGYSRRYLDLLFRRQVGLSPKLLASIFRFQTLYQKWARGVPYEVLKEEVYDNYYDQAHFSRAALDTERNVPYGMGTKLEFVPGISSKSVLER